MAGAGVREWALLPMLDAIDFAEELGMMWDIEAERRRAGARGGRGCRSKGPLSAKSVQNIHICLRAALNDAVTADPPLMTRNVAIGAYTYNRRKNRQEMLTWTVEEVRTFLAFTAKDADHALWWTALMTGMRRGELLGLRRRDLVLDRVVRGRRVPALNVRQQYTRDGEVAGDSSA